MANYIKATNFAAKDGLPSGDSGKIVKGTEIDTEFTSIASAITSKADSNSPTFTGTPTAPTAISTTNTTQLATTAFVKSAIDALGLSVVQVVTSNFTSVFSSTSTSFVATGHTATITPTSVDSKILCLVHTTLAQQNSVNLNANLTLYRGATNLAGTGNSFVDTLNSAGNIYSGAAIVFYDSPETTSAITYQPYVLTASGGLVYYNNNGSAVTAGTSTIILMEIL
jgi:hypothetical protein